jgi:hypothetical protein
MGIKFTTIVLCVDIDVDLIRESDDLHVVYVIENLNASEGSIRNQPRAMARLCAHGDFYALRVTDRRVRLGRAEETKV